MSCLSQGSLGQTKDGAVKSPDEIIWQSALSGFCVAMQDGVSQFTANGLPSTLTRFMRLK